MTSFNMGFNEKSNRLSQFLKLIEVLEKTEMRGKCKIREIISGAFALKLTYSWADLFMISLVTEIIPTNRIDEAHSNLNNRELNIFPLKMCMAQDYAQAHIYNIGFYVRNNSQLYLSEIKFIFSV